MATDILIEVNGDDIDVTIQGGYADAFIVRWDDVADDYDYAKDVYDYASTMDEPARTRIMDTVAEIWPTIEIDPNGPLTDDQRKALFAGFRDAFGYDADAEDRYLFTRKVLGKPGGHDVSWAADKPGTITYAEASRLLDVLDAVKELV